MKSNKSMQSLSSAEQKELKNLYEETLKELEHYKGSRLKYKRLYTQTREELEHYKGSRLKYKRLYTQTREELEHYKGSRLKYKRLASHYEYKYNRVSNTFFYKIYYSFKALYTSPKKNNHINNISKENIEKTVANTVAINKDTHLKRETIFELEKIKDFSFGDALNPVTIIYADININTVDGSSIWLSSIVNLFNSFNDVVIVSRFNIENSLITSNFKHSNFKKVLIEPKDLGLKNNLKLSDISLALIYLDELLPSVQNLVVRGSEAIEEIIKTNNFKGRLVPYLTNFYTQKKTGPAMNQDKQQALTSISHQAKIWLWQTEEMKLFVNKYVKFKNEKHILFPPILDKKDFDIVESQISNKNKNKNKNIIIGYAGKIQPDWGVLELINEVENLNKNGFNITLKIISSKISWRGTFKSGEYFIETVKKALKKDFVEYIQNVNRNTAISLLKEVDYIWSYRHADFENSTLELSTKLLEGVALGKPLISYPSLIHKRVLGDDYPFFINTPSELANILNTTVNNSELNTLAGEIIDEYSFENRKTILEKIITKMHTDKLTIASNDYKFIDHFISNLKNKGYLVYKDFWEWGKADNIKRSEKMYETSDIIFCEWGLANAVWYSQKNISNKPLFIRLHAQEVRQKAMKFGKQIDTNNVTNFIFVSERIKTKALDLFKWPTEKIVHIPNYVLTDDFRPLDISKPLKMNFGMVGITPQSKRLDRALDLMEAILEKQPDAKLFIKGHRPENYEWMHAPGRVKELDYYYQQYDRIENSDLLKKAIVFDGFGNNMPEWYQKIDFILSPSDHESFHYALADGVASGCTPIIWPWESSEIIYDKSWIVQDEQDALKRVVNLSKNNNIIKVKEKNLELIHKRYGYKKIYKQILALMENKYVDNKRKTI